MNINRRSFLKTIGAGVVSWNMANAFFACKKTSARPNIIFIMADDMGYGDPGCYNPGSKTPTPNIDRLANQGMRFTNAHSPGAVCVPARYGLLTGRYPFRTDLGKQNRTSLIEPNRLTIGSLLQKHGYKTGCIGKWHLGFDDFDKHEYSKPMKGGPFDRGFDYFFGMHASLDIPPYYYIENDRCVEAPTEDIEASHSEGVSPIQGAFWRAGKIAPGFKHDEVLPLFTEKAVAFIKDGQTSQAPFFLYFALAAPHTPWLPNDEFKGKSESGEYGDYVAQVDGSVGRILDTLGRLGMEDNTLLFFTSDNGPVWSERDVQRYDHRSTHYLKGMKGDAWEGGHRMPFIARWPGKIAGNSVCHENICFTDMLATFAALMGDTLPENSGEDSFNILPALVKDTYKKPVREAIVIENRVIIEGDWKLIFGSGKGGISRRYFKRQADESEKTAQKGELYNLKDDPSEDKNLYGERPDLVQHLTELMEKYRLEGRSALRVR
jgi:arylsulfatase A